MTNDQSYWRIELDPPEPVTSENSCKKQLRNCTICGKDWVSHEGDAESRSRFKEEVLRALEAKRDGFVFFGESFTGPDDPKNRMWVLELACKYHKRALQEAIETIKGL